MADSPFCLLESRTRKWRIQLNDAASGADKLSREVDLYFRKL